MQGGFTTALNEDEILAIEGKIGYSFKDKRLLSKAFTHSSYVNENKGSVSNERLEFLGDRILNLVCAEDLFFNNADNEGKLTEQLKNMVSSAPLKKSIEKLGLNQFIKTSAGLDVNGTNSKAISDLFEALLAAIYIDSGELDSCREFISIHLKQVDIHDYISTFKEWCEKNKKDAEKSTDEKKEGGNPMFFYNITVDGKRFVGKGRKIKDAEKAACQTACEFFGI